MLTLTQALLMASWTRTLLHVKNPGQDHFMTKIYIYIYIYIYMCVCVCVCVCVFGLFAQSKVIGLGWAAENPSVSRDEWNGGKVLSIQKMRVSLFWAQVIFRAVESLCCSVHLQDCRIKQVCLNTDLAWGTCHTGFYSCKLTELTLV